MQYALRPQNCGYQRREPEQELLHSVLQEHLETFLSDVRSDMYALPRHVEGELRDYLRCGDGFQRTGKGTLKFRCAPEAPVC